MWTPILETIIYSGIAIILGVLLAFVISSKATAYEAPFASPTIVINPGYLIIKGNNLDEVEIWALPSGEAVTESDKRLIGNCFLQRASAGQKWLYPIDRIPILSSYVFAKSYDKQGTLVGISKLPYYGAVEIYDAICSQMRRES